MHACGKDETMMSPTCKQVWNKKNQWIQERKSKLNFDCTIVFLVSRSSKQDHTWLCLHDIYQKYFLIWNNYFQLQWTNILITRTNDYFYEQKIKHDEQIIMFSGPNIKHHGHLIV